MKICKVCGIEKPLTEFSKKTGMKDGHLNQCKSCEKEINNKWYQENLEKKKDYRKENAEKIKHYLKEYRKNNSQTIKEYHKEYYQDNSEKVKHRVKKYKRNRYKTDTLFRLSCNVRGMVHRAIKNKRTEEIIGCSFQELKLHLEKQFTEGMSWENYGEWHIDHKKPLSWFDITDPDEVDKANHYSNLQPLWAEENLIKGNRFAS